MYIPIPTAETWIRRFIIIMHGECGSNADHSELWTSAVLMPDVHEVPNYLHKFKRNQPSASRSSGIMHWNNSKFIEGDSKFGIWKMYTNLWYDILIAELHRKVLSTILENDDNHNNDFIRQALKKRVTLNSYSSLCTGMNKHKSGTEYSRATQICIRVKSQ